MSIGRNLDEMLKGLTSQGVDFIEGGHTVYIPPQRRLAAILGSFVELYPGDAGFKILKQAKGPDQARYISDYRRYSRLLSYVTGPPVENVRAANFLHLFSLGPRLYDLVGLSTDNGAMLTVFVVKHVAGSEPSTQECHEFLKELDAVVSSGKLSLNMPNWREHPDFGCPDCSGNLIMSEDHGKAQYVDFQNFIPRNYEHVAASILSQGRADLHFGNQYLVRRGRYLYQSIREVSAKGKRDIDVRWDVIQELLRAADIELKQRLILDIGCNAGMMLAQSLADGAVWGLGWDRPDVVGHAKRILWALGYTRFELVGADLSQTYGIQDDVPARLERLLPQSVVFYLAMYNHIGFIDALGRLPWKALVYEGHEGDSLEELSGRLAEIKNVGSFSIKAAREYTDGDSGMRPIAILVRD